MTYAADAANGVAPPAKSRGNFERVYRTALRHSRHVRWLRIGTIAGIVTVLLIVLAANYMPPLGEFRLPGEIGNLVIQGPKIIMGSPRLAGYTTDSRAYEFTANTAAQDINKPDMLELDQIRATMEMADKTTVKMTAATGLYDLKGEMLTLNKDIVLISSTGYQGFLSEAVVDMRKGNVVSEKPVRVNMLNGFLNAKRLEVIDNGELLRFGGGVAMTLQPSKGATKVSE
jgi:lipopolysaccharide export system protein LptC